MIDGNLVYDVQEHLAALCDDHLFPDEVARAAIEYRPLAIALIERHDPTVCEECEYGYDEDASFCDDAMTEIDRLLLSHTRPVISIGGWRCVMTSELSNVFCQHGFAVDAIVGTVSNLRDWIDETAADVIRVCCAYHAHD